MSDEMKMRYVFKDGCNAFNSYLVDDYEDPDNLMVIANFNMDYVQIVGEKMAYYAAHAINNHDRLTEENKKLREALEKTLPVVNRAAAMDDSDAKLVIRGVQKLLSELGGEL
ncbi:TPA: hypothetical protein ACMDNH_001797 [Vibrio cholerae]